MPLGLLVMSIAVQKTADDMHPDVNVLLHSQVALQPAHSGHEGQSGRFTVLQIPACLTQVNSKPYRSPLSIEGGRVSTKRKTTRS